MVESSTEHTTLSAGPAGRAAGPRTGASPGGSGRPRWRKGLYAGGQGGVRPPGDRSLSTAQGPQRARSSAGEAAGPGRQRMPRAGIRLTTSSHPAAHRLLEAHAPGFLIKTRWRPATPSGLAGVDRAPPRGVAHPGPKPAQHNVVESMNLRSAASAPATGRLARRADGNALERRGPGRGKSCRSPATPPPALRQPAQRQVGLEDCHQTCDDQDMNAA